MRKILANNLRLIIPVSNYNLMSVSNRKYSKPLEQYSLPYILNQV